MSDERSGDLDRQRLADGSRVDEPDILTGMSSVADALRDESRARLRRMTPGERLAEALLLGQRAITAYAAAHGLDRPAARRDLERAAQRGRRASRVMRDLPG